MKLTDKQLLQFQTDGFLLIRNFVPKSYTDEILACAKQELESRNEPIELESEYIGINNEKYAHSIRRLRQVYDRNKVFANWMKYPPIKEILEQIVNDKVSVLKAHHNSIMTKLPHTSTHTSWHQDIRYWRYSNDNIVSVWLALGDENQQNGALEFIPKSHIMEFNLEQFDEKMYFIEDYQPNQTIIGTKQSFDLGAGDIVLFHAKTLHRANANHSDFPKISFVYSAKAKYNTPLHGTISEQYDEIDLD